jgi:hypothetical protein
MGHQLDSQAIETRLREIREKISALQVEADELEVALRVFERFSPSESTSKKKTRDKPKLGPARPQDIPTNFEMTEMILKASERDGKNGLTANEIVEQIGSRYWPGVTGAQILPVIYHFARQGRIRKTSGGKFKSLHKSSEGTNAAMAETA